MASKSASLTAALGNSLYQRFGRMLIMKAREKYLISENEGTGHLLQ